MAWYTVYTLRDPSTPDVVRYVGITRRSVNIRLNEHLSECRLGKGSYKDNWIRQLLSKGVKPILVVELLNCGIEDESKIIEKYDSDKLTNSESGGEGLYTRSAYTKNKQSASLKEYYTTKDGIAFKERLSRFRLGTKIPDTQERRCKISEALKGKKHTAQHRENNRKAQIGKKCSIETRKRMSEAHRRRHSNKECVS